MTDTEREDRGIIAKIIDLSAGYNGVDPSDLALKILQREDSPVLSKKGALFVRTRELIRQNPHGKRQR